MMEINIVSTILSALYPGLGQFKNVEITKGLFLFLFFTMVLMMALYPGTQIQLVGYILIPLVWVWNVVDASQFFMYRPGVAVEASRIQRMLIYVVIGWLVIEVAFVAFMWFAVHEEPVEKPAEQPGSEWLILPEETNPEETNPALVPETSTGSTPEAETNQPLTPSASEAPAAPAPMKNTHASSIDQQAGTEEPSPSPSVQEHPSGAHSVFGLSLGIFAGPIQAGEQRDAAIRAGFPAEVNKIQVRQRLRYIVLVPGFDVLGDANTAADALRQHARFKDCSVVRYSKLKLVE